VLILLVSERLATIPDTKWSNTVRHENSVFHDLLKRVPWDDFDRLVQQHHADKHVRRLSTKSQLIALLYGQLSGAVSLREIVGGLDSHATRLYHLGGKPVSRSTFADANALRPADLFSDLFALMAARLHRGLRRKMAEAVYLIDSTGLRLSTLSADWARFSRYACGAKLHVIYDPAADQPVYSSITAANVNDITPAKNMPIERGATYVFDMGYYDFGWWAKLDAQDCRIVTRFKSNTLLQVTQDLAVPEGQVDILSDRIGLLPARLSRSRRNPFAKPVREVRLRIPTGKILRILSNDLVAPAREIADLYKRRWAIELFFRWVKQSLKIKHFLGTSENALRIQIAAALIAFLLLRMAQADQKDIESPLAFARLVRTNLMHRKQINQLRRPQPEPTDTSSKTLFQWAQI